MITRPDLVEHLREQASISESRAKKTLDALFHPDQGIIAEGLASGEEVHIAGFGKFVPKTRQPRLARNPRNNNTVEIPARTVATFRPGAGLRRRLSGDTDPGEEGE